MSNATVAPSRLPEFFQEIQDAFTQAGDEDSVFPIRHFYQRWGAAVAIERRPSVAARLHVNPVTVGKWRQRFLGGRLEGLADDCASDGRYECFFTSAPLNLPAGVASPPNALAIK